ncbi:MAG: ATP-binding protein [Bdellovibrionota bacterium]
MNPPFSATSYTPLKPIESKYQEKLKVLLFSRVCIALSLLAATMFFQPGADNPSSKLHQAFVLVTLCHVFVSIVLLALYYFSNIYYFYRFGFLQLVWDILFHTVIIYLTGGVDSQFKFLYWLTIIHASILFLKPGAIYVAAISALLYGILANLAFFNSIPDLLEDLKSISNNWPEQKVTISIIVNAGACFLIAYLSAFVSGRMYQVERLLEEKNTEVKNLETLMERSKHLAAIGEMAARIAHEIRNPLTSLSASIDLLNEKSNMEHAEAKLFAIIKKETRRLNQLLTDFLSFSRPSESQKQMICLSQVLVESISNFQAGYPHVTIDCKMTLENEMEIYIDPKQINQVLINGLKNASEAMDLKGNIVVHLKEYDSVYYRIVIEDFGPGMDAGMKDKVFEPFHTSKIKGTGLGLSIVKGIVSSHRGRVSLRDKENQKGCELVIDLPKERL